jgi:two-component system, OmpR family, KDP operon response regulator KdpE
MFRTANATAKVRRKSVIQPLVLVVIDEPALRYLFTINLSLRGFEVIDIKGSNEVISFANKIRPDLIILDLMIGSVNGFDVCKSLCEKKNSSIIAFNMRGGDTDLLKCLDMGVDDYIGKPFGIDELIARVNAVLRKTRFNQKIETQKYYEGSKA